jgi:hypothetical protein
MPVIANGTTSYGEQSKRSYIATGVFNTAFYSYTSARDVNNVTQYTLAVNPLATVLNCKAGHILKENGRKLVPGANPGVTNYMVGVFDSSSLLNGFIDPNNSLFAVYSTNMPNFVARNTDPAIGPDGTTNDMGPSVFTTGSVTAAKQIRSTTVTALTIVSSAVSIDASLGQVFTVIQSGTSPFTVNSPTVAAVGSLVYLIVTNTGSTATITLNGTNVRGPSVSSTGGKTTAIAFVSDGTTLQTFGVSTSA